MFSTFTGNAWDNKGPKGMKYHSDVMRQDLIERTKDAGQGYNVSVKPATTNSLVVFKRGEGFNAGPAHDENYRADFPVGEGKKGKGIFYEGDLSISRHRTVGLVNELIESHIQHGDPQATQTMGGPLRKLTVDEQQAKLEDLQRALLEEAAFLDRLKNMEGEEPLCCEAITGDRDKSACGGCIRFHWPICEIDKNECSVM